MIDNVAIAELLMREADNATGHRQMAFQRASHQALLWPEEASTLAKDGRPLTDLTGIGPSLSRKLHRWLQDRPQIGLPPLNRREFLSLTKARKILSKHPTWVNEVRGDLQMHTVWSDGSGTVSQMAEAAKERGYEYIAITDHTQGLKIARGLDESRLSKQAKEIDVLNREFTNAKVRFTVLRSAEMNLSPSGEGDMPARALRKLDLVLGCFHSSLRSADDQTSRYVAALRNPHVDILGHPQTRVYNRRQGLKADWARVFAEAAKLHKAVEIDGYADRQDLRPSLLRIAKSEGTTISLGTDSHEPEQLRFMDFCLANAALAGIETKNVLNFRSLPLLRTWVAKSRSKR